MDDAPANPIRILLIDDHRVVRAGLRMLIESQPGWKVVGEAATRSQALASLQEEVPDIILLDLDLGGEKGLDFLPELRAAAPEARVIILTGLRDPQAQQKAFRLGAVGLVLKENAAEVLLKAIEKVQGGEVWLDRSTVAEILGGREGESGPDPETLKLASLTPREKEIIALIAEGLKNKQIADRLFISETTVRHHLTSIFDKLEVGDRLELLLYAYRHGLARPPDLSRR